MTTATRADVHQTAVDQRRRLGWTHLAAEAAGMWVLYALLAFMVSSACEEALVDASGASGTAVNRLVSETLAEITRDHPGSTVSGILLLLAPAALIVATRRTREVTGQHWGEGLAWLGAFVWWSYMVVDAGLFLDPDHLRPLTRDLDGLTVPLVSGGAVPAVLTFAMAVWSLRRNGWRPVVGTVAAVAAVALLVRGVVTLVTSAFDEPVAPVGLLPAERVLGVALVLPGRRRGDEPGVA